MRWEVPPKNRACGSQEKNHFHNNLKNQGDSKTSKQRLRCRLQHSLGIVWRPQTSPLQLLLAANAACRRGPRAGGPSKTERRAKAQPGPGPRLYRSYWVGGGRSRREAALRLSSSAFTESGRPRRGGGTGRRGCSARGPRGGWVWSSRADARAQAPTPRPPLGEPGQPRPDPPEHLCAGASRGLGGWGALTSRELLCYL